MALRPVLGLAPLLALTLFPLTSSFAAEMEARTLKETLATELPGALAAYRLWDATNRNGIGNSDAKTSGGLGWGESSFLRNYMLCYTVTHDTYWLDKVIDHFDRMIGNLSGPDKDGYRAWSDTDYSVGIVRVEPVGEVGGLTVGPAVQRPNVRQGGELVTGHEYRLELTAEGRIRVLDVTDNKELAAPAYADPTVIGSIPGAATPFGWTVATWTPDEGGRGEWVGEAHQGKKAIALIGGAKANVIAMPYRDLPGRGGQTVTVTAYTRTIDAARPAFSVLGHDQDGKRVQYETFALPPSADWRQGSWAVKLAEGVAAFNIVLRNNGQGTVLYDDEVKIR